MHPGVRGLPGTRRLLKSAEYARVFAAATRSSDRFFTVLASPNNQPNARLGLAISRRAAKRAVDRNRLKRLAREAFRLDPNLCEHDFIVLAKPPAAKASRQDLRASLERHFVRLVGRQAAKQPTRDNERTP